MFDGLSAANVTPAVLLGIAVLLIFLGRLIPWPTYRDKSAECERWHKAYEVEREARVTSNAQTVELLELAKTSHSILVAWFGTVGTTRQSGGADVVVPTPR